MELFEDLECQPDTRSYITGVFYKFRHSREDLSKHNLTLLFAQAHEKQNFLIYQNLADYLFFKNSYFDEYNKNYYDNLARLSYLSCYRLIQKKWKLFEELADNLVHFEKEIKNKFISLRKSDPPYWSIY